MLLETAEEKEYDRQETGEGTWQHLLTQSSKEAAHTKE